MSIQPASAPVASTQQNFTAAEPESPVRSKAGPLTIAGLIQEDKAVISNTNTSGKGSLKAVSASPTPVTDQLRPLSLSYANASSLNDLFTNIDAIERRDGAPQPFVRDDELVVRPLGKQDKSALERLIAAFMPGGETDDAGNSSVNAAAKADRQVVNRAGKADFSPESTGMGRIWQQGRTRSSEVLKVVEAPLSFNQD
jgi:hypothetical protein